MSELKTYSELITLPTFNERFEYLKLSGGVGKDTFGFDRYLNQAFYKSKEWKKIRDYIVTRDNGCDLGIGDKPIYGKLIIHHMNPITANDIKYVTEELINPEYLICTCMSTHNNIHYGTKTNQVLEVVERSPNDTIPWRK